MTSSARPRSVNARVQQYLLDNVGHLAAGAFDREEVLEALVLDVPEHSLWAHFGEFTFEGCAVSYLRRIFGGSAAKLDSSLLTSKCCTSMA